MPIQNMLFRLPICLVAGLIAAAPAVAQDLSLYGGTALQYHTKNDDGPKKIDLNGYLELEYKGLYGGVWAELTDWDDYTEVDLYLGYRGEAGQFSYDVNYYYYIYTETPSDDDYGELGASVGYALTDVFSLGAEAYHQPESGDNSAYLTASLAATDRLSLDVSWGRYQTAGDWANEWEVGVGYALGDETAVELRYYDGQDYDDYLRLQLTWDTTILTR